VPPTATRVPPTPVPPTPVPPTPIPITYSIVLTTDKSTYDPGEQQTICYRMTPPNVPYSYRILQSDGGPYVSLWQATDDGVGGGDCLSNFRVSATAPPGGRVYKVEAFINGALVASDTTDYTVKAKAVTYSMNLDVEGSTFHPGETIDFCYELQPNNVPYQARLLNGSTVVRTWNDNGVNGGDCTTVSISRTSTLGQKTLTVQAVINGAVVAQDSATITVVDCDSESCYTVSRMPAGRGLGPCSRTICLPLVPGLL
jgi:hypothetical protein